MCEEDKLDLALEILKKAKEKGVNVYIPTDAVNADAFDANANTQLSKTDETPDGWMGLDIGEETIAVFSNVIENSRTILWNGPMGVFEMEKFASGTSAIAQAIAKATAKGAFSLIGGGDSVAAINKNKLADKVSYVSTGCHAGVYGRQGTSRDQSDPRISIIEHSISKSLLNQQAFLFPELLPFTLSGHTHFLPLTV